MKLRIEGNSVRFRLSKSEVEKLASEEYLEQEVDFGIATFTYAVNLVRDSNNLYADYSDGLMVLHVPHELADRWIKTDTVGLEHNLDLDGYGRHLLLLLEKDFKCTGKEGAGDQSDRYDNPKANC
jgi:hypothetical protein